MAKIAGRQVEIGIGIEATAGTAVAATDYIKWDSFTMQGQSDKIMLNSARGIRNKASNSIINKKYGKGDVEFAPTVDILPYFLSLAMGSRSSGTASGESRRIGHDELSAGHRLRPFREDREAGGGISCCGHFAYRGARCRGAACVAVSACGRGDIDDA